jgi:hypothetical protein
MLDYAHDRSVDDLQGQRALSRWDNEGGAGAPTSGKHSGRQALLVGRGTYRGLGACGTVTEGPPSAPEQH